MCVCVCVCRTGTKPSWTARLLSDPALLCRKVREEAGELCETLEKSEGRERAASEAADLIYHAMVLLNLQVWFDCVLHTHTQLHGPTRIQACRSSCTQVTCTGYAGMFDRARRKHAV